MRTAWIALIFVTCGAFAIALAPPSAKISSGSEEPDKGSHADNQADSHNQSPSPQVIVNVAPSAVDIQPKAEEHHENDNSRAERWTAEATIALAIGTGILAFFTGLLVRDAKATSRKELRAYVFIETSTIDGIMVGGKPKAKFIIRNFGKTPAEKFTIGVNHSFGTSFDNSNPKEIMPSKSRGTVAPKARVTCSAELPPLTDEQMTQLAAGTHSIFVYGKIGYVDFSGEPRFTDFRTEKNAGGDLRSPTLMSNEYGNDSN